MAYIGHPLAGDTLYGGTTEDLSRHALHCGVVRFVHPVTHRPLRVSCPLPADMLALAQSEHLLEGWQYDRM